MRRLIGTILAVGAAAALLAGCAGGQGEPRGTWGRATMSAAPMPSSSDDVAAWARTVLPEDRPGGVAAVARGTGRVEADEAVVDSATPSGEHVALVACMSADGRPLTLRIGGTDAATEVPCAAPGADAPGATRVTLAGGTDARLHLEGAAGTVYAYEIRPRAGDAD